MKELILEGRKLQEVYLKQVRQIEALEKLREIAENREKFIDWMIERHLDIVKDYLGFNE